LIFIFIPACPIFTVMDSRKLARLCRELADDKKAEDILILDMRKLSSVADYFVIATGSSEPHLRAIIEEIRDKLREAHALRPRAVDGAAGASWVVLDYSDVVVHVMRTETRTHYNLEGLWSDAPRVRIRRKPIANAR
jgi:ribosome-associated protein